MPTGHRGGLGFTETNNDFEIRPIPETNIFIIRQTETANTDCSCVCMHWHFICIEFSLQKFHYVFMT